MKKTLLMLYSFCLCSCFQSTLTVSPATQSTSSSNLSECSVGFVTSGPCAVNKSGVAISQDFGSDILNWTNPSSSTVITAHIPNGFYANQSVSFTEPNLAAGNIKSGISIFGVTGTLNTGSCDTAVVFSGATATTGITATNVTVQWTGIGSIAGYIILNTTTTPYVLVGSATSAATSYTVAGLTANTAYKFRVRALSTTGASDCNSVDVSVTTAVQSTPSDLSGLAIWLKAESLSGNTNGGSVTSWADSSGNGRQFTSAGAAQPTYRANILNSFGGVEFDGVNDEMSFGADYATNNFTLFYVATPTGVHEIEAEATAGDGGTVGQSYLSYPVQSGTDGGAGVSFATNGISVYEHGNSYLPALAVTGGTYSGPTIVVVSYSGKQPTIYSSHTLLRTGLTSAVPNVHAPRHLGATALTSFSGNVHEFISFNRTLSAPERTDIVNYLKSKFNL